MLIDCYILENCASRDSLPYRIYIPEKYNLNRRYPLVLYLHAGRQPVRIPLLLNLLNPDLSQRDPIGKSKPQPPEELSIVDCRLSIHQILFAAPSTSSGHAWRFSFFLFVLIRVNSWLKSLCVLCVFAVSFPQSQVPSP